MSGLSLREADKLEVTVLIDNYTDVFVLQETDIVKRPKIPPPDFLLAEHGLSCLLKVYRGTEEHILLMDTGGSSICLLHNASLLNVDSGKVEAVVLSHGHPDHIGGLVDFLSKAANEIPVVLHPDAFLQRALNIPNTLRRVEPCLDEVALRKAGAVLHKIRGVLHCFQTSS